MVNINATNINKRNSKTAAILINEFGAVSNQLAESKYRASAISVLLLLCSLLFAGSALAAREPVNEGDTYFGVDLVYNNLDLEDSGSTFNPITARFRLGVNIFPDLVPSIAFESHFAFDISDDEQAINGQDATLKIDHQFGIYAKPYYEITETGSIYGLVGFGAVQVQGDTARAALTDDTDSSFSLGLGGQFTLPFDFDMDAHVEVIQLITGDNMDVVTVSFGISVPL